MIASPRPLDLITVALFGLLFGSFLNVVIHRLPRRESVVWPGSRCPACGRKLPWYENVPLLSYTFLRGRCRGCGVAISLRYPVVEAVTACVLVLVLARWGMSPPFFLFAAYSLALVALFAIDLEHQLLPNAITYPGTAAGLAVAAWNPQVTLLESALGAALGSGLLLALAEGYRRFRGIEGLGMGDVKLAAMIGAWGGPKAVIAVLLLSSLVGVVFGLSLIALGRAGMQTAIPYGCFLTPAAFLVALLGADFLWQGWRALLVEGLYGGAGG